MSILSKHLRSKKPGSQTSSSSTLTDRPKLYVLASAPATSDKPDTTEWSLQVSVPPKSDTMPPQSSRTLPPQPQSKHTLFSHRLHKHDGEPIRSTPLITDTTTQQPTPLAHTNYYFSRLAPDSFGVQPPTTILKIFLCSLPPTHPTSSSNSTLPTQLASVLSPIQTTPDSISYLRQALLALQVSEIIPGISHGLDVNKFMNFAAAYLDQQIRNWETEGTDSVDREVKRVNYSRIARENERLRKMLSSDATDYAVVNASAGVGGKGNLLGAQSDAGDDEEDLWNVPVQSAAQDTRSGKGSGNKLGGFWVTYGSGATPRARSGERDRREPWQGRDPYGGLM